MSFELCIRCADLCHYEEISDDVPGHCLCCASDVLAQVAAERSKEFRGRARDWFELVAHRQSVRHLEWIDIKKADAALAAKAVA